MEFKNVGMCITYYQYVYMYTSMKFQITCILLSEWWCNFKLHFKILWYKSVVDAWLNFCISKHSIHSSLLKLQFKIFYKFSYKKYNTPVSVHDQNVLI